MTYEMLKKKTKTELIDIIVRESQPTTDGTSATIKEIWNIDMNYSQENFILLCLNSDNKVVKKKVLFKGGISSAPVDLKVLFHEVLIAERCTRFIVSHNHPSGRLTPSKVDLRITEQIKEAAKILSLNFLDHIIFTENKFYSFLEEEIL